MTGKVGDPLAIVRRTTGCGAVRRQPRSVFPHHFESIIDLFRSRYGHHLVWGAERCGCLLHCRVSVVGSRIGENDNADVCSAGNRREQPCEILERPAADV